LTFIIYDIIILVMMMLKNKLNLFPSKSGCYLMKDKNNSIIYVGKALNIKNRLNSYFYGNHSGKTLLMINEINNIEYIVTSNELEALLLEINLIKKYRPKYNIMLKDDKSYPYIELTNDKYPKLVIVRNINYRKKKNDNLFGPYPNVNAARKTLNLLNRIYPLRKCSTFRKSECLYYHLNQCLGYCIKNIENKEINNMKNEIIRFLKGDHTLITSKIKIEMNESCEKMQYEKALELKELLNYIEITLKDQIIDLKTGDNLDVFGYYYDKTYLSTQVFFVRSGKLVGRTANIFQSVDTIEEELIEYIINFYFKNNIKPLKIIVPSIVDSKLLELALKIKVMVPKKGKYKNILDMSSKNAMINFEQRWETIKNNDDKVNKALMELANILNIESIKRIEMFDNSNLFGTFYVSGMVVFIDGKPEKNEYRKYKLDTLTVVDDLSAMREVIYRRYFKVLNDNLVKPDLIIVDGGINQVNVAKEVIVNLKLNIPVVGLKKDNNHDTNGLIANEPLEVVNIDKKSSLFQLLSIIQEEAHRFSLSYHRNIRSKGALFSELNLINGIGKKRVKTLLKKYGSLNNMKNASIDELSTITPYKIACNLYNFLQNKI